MDFFNDYSHTLEKEQQVRDEIRTQTRELSRVCREIESKCLKIQNQTDDEKAMQATCIEIKELYSELAPYWATIAESISANDLSTEKFTDMWNFPLVTKFVFLGAFIHWILTGELLSLADAQALIMSPTHSHTLTATNATPQTSNSDDTVMTTTTTAAAVTPSVEVEIEIDLEVYLSGIASLPRELSRLCVNSIRCGNYSLPPRINSFVSDLYSGFRLLNLRNGALRKKFDSIKYDLQKLEEIMYDIAVRKLTDDKKQAGETDQ